MKKISSIGKKKFSSLENMKQGWNKFALEYGTNIEKHNLSTQVTLDYLLDIQKCESVIDIACGTGFYGAFRALRKHQS